MFIKKICLSIIILVLLSSFLYGCSCNSTNITDTKNDINISENIENNKTDFTNNLSENSINGDNKDKNNYRENEDKSVITKNKGQNSNASEGGKTSEKSYKKQKEKSEDDVIYGTEANELPIIRN